MSESISFIRGIGIEATRIMLNGTANTRYIPLSHIRELIIYEHIGVARVRNYFGCLVYEQASITIPIEVGYSC